MRSSAVQPITAEFIGGDIVDTSRLIVEVDRIEDNDTVVP
jgi:hypothetical protein